MAEVAVFRVMMMIDITEWGCGSWYWFCNGVLEAGVAYWMLCLCLFGFGTVRGVCAWKEITRRAWMSCLEVAYGTAS